MDTWAPANKTAAAVAGGALALALGGAALAGRGLLKSGLARVGAGIARGAMAATGDMAKTGLRIGKAAYRGAMFSPVRGARGQGWRTPIFTGKLFPNGKARPLQFSSAFQNRIVGGTVAVGGAIGFAEGVKDRHKTYRSEVSPSGRHEMTRPDMMGASGDIPLTLHANRAGGRM